MSSAPTSARRRRPSVDGGRGDGAAEAAIATDFKKGGDGAAVRAVNDPCTSHCIASLVVAIGTVVCTPLLILAALEPARQRELGIDELSSAAFFGLVTAALTMACCACTCFAGRRRLPDRQFDSAVGHPELYAQQGVGDTAGLAPRDLYLDLMKRSVSNLVYQDPPMWVYGVDKMPQLVDGFSLERRVRGEDWPIQAHTMIGMRRLENLQELVQSIVARRVPGDVIETGVLRGGSCIFMKACLRAFGGEEGRRVIACDTFHPVPKTPTDPVSRYVVLPLVRALGSVPIPSFNRAVFMAMQRIPNPVRSFPVMEDPSDATVQVGMFLMRNVGNFPDQAGTSVDEVKDHFARYGLLDDKVVTLRGFFSQTLPGADIDKLALVRLDGDTYESTITAIEPLYPKLSSGGFVIVDDYHAFDECKRAIDEYRTKHGITEPLKPIDNMAVYWQKK